MIDILTKAALDAGQAIMAVHRAGPHVSYKDDCSPVTEADQRAEVIILQALAAHFPEIPVIAEEAVSNGILPETGTEFFLVDPLDGTKEFISGKDDFTVNIALIRNGVPVVGVVYAPCRGQAWTGKDNSAEKLAISGEGAILARHPIRARQRGAGGRTLDCEGRLLAYEVRGDGEDALANPDFIAEGAMAVAADIAR